VKFPSRNRPKKFLSVLSDYINKASDNTNIVYLITIDLDDTTMTTEIQERAKALSKNVFFFTGRSKSKIEACNRDIHYIEQWDIIMLASDDMICQAEGWDEQIRKDMPTDMDMVLYYPDGFTQLNTMCIMGRKYYDRFGYIYNPEYTSLFCDDEFQQVSQKLGKEKKSNLTLFRHEHPIWMGSERDELLNKNESYYHIDKKVFEGRKLNNFWLK